MNLKGNQMNDKISPMVMDTSGWYRKAQNAELYCGWCLPARAALAHQAHPERKWITTETGDFLVLAGEVLDRVPEAEKNLHRGCEDG